MRTVATILVVVALLVLIGCGGGGGGGSSSPPPVSRIGAIEGFIFSGPGGGPPITLGATATPPSAGLVPLAGASVAVADSTGAATTEANGHFLLRGATAGLRTLRVTPAGGAPADFPVTILGDATIRVGEPTVKRQQAMELVKQAVAQSIPLENAFILGPQQPLPAGVRVAPAMGDDKGEDDPSLVTRPSSPQWFFFVDTESDAYFQHPVRYFFVDAESGNVTIRDATSWPTINSLNYYADRNVNLTSPDMIQAPAGARSVSSGAPAPAEVKASPVVTRSHEPGLEDPKTFGLLVVGAKDLRSFVENRIQVQGLIGRGGIPPPGEVRVLELERRETVLRQFEEICSRAGAGDTLVFYLTTHGTKDGGALLASRDTFEDGSVRARQEYIRPEDFDFSKCRACHILVIVDTCFAGHWKEKLGPKLAGLQGREAVLMTSSDTAHIAYGFIKNTEPSRFTSPVVRAFRGLAGPDGTQKVDPARVFEFAKGELENSEDPDVRQQNPQFFQRVPNPDETCAGVRLSPASATVTANGRVTLTVVEPKPEEGSFVFHWSTSGTQGRLEDSQGHSGKDFDSTDRSVTYVANAGIENGKTDTVTVEVFTPGPVKKSLGKAQSTITAVARPEEPGGFFAILSTAKSNDPNLTFTVINDNAPAPVDTPFPRPDLERSFSPEPKERGGTLTLTVTPTTATPGEPPKVIRHFFVTFPQDDPQDPNPAVLIRKPYLDIRLTNASNAPVTFTLNLLPGQVSPGRYILQVTTDDGNRIQSFPNITTVTLD